MQARRIAPAVVLALLFCACSDDGNPNGATGVCATGTYELIPEAGQPYSLTEDYRFLCLDSSLDPDIEYIYEDCSDESSGYFSFYDGGMATGFRASLGEYRFIGSIIRDFGSGVGPFASGAYERSSGGATIEVGTFSFTEGEIEFPGTLECLR
jgi:hypothetical protein